MKNERRENGRFLEPLISKALPPTLLPTFLAFDECF
jgi:hypothetical protein